jgi:hypothetical protein
LLASSRYSNVTISVHHEEERATWSGDVLAVQILSGSAIVRGEEDPSHELLIYPGDRLQVCCRLQPVGSRAHGLVFISLVFRLSFILLFVLPFYIFLFLFLFSFNGFIFIILVPYSFIALSLYVRFAVLMGVTVKSAV